MTWRLTWRSTCRRRARRSSGARTPDLAPRALCHTWLCIIPAILPTVLRMALMCPTNHSTVACTVLAGFSCPTSFLDPYMSACMCPC